MEPGSSSRSKEGETSSRLSENLTPPHSPQITRNVTTWNLQRTEQFWDDNRTRYEVSSILGLTDGQNPWGLGKGSRQNRKPLRVRSTREKFLSSTLQHAYTGSYRLRGPKEFFLINGTTLHIASKEDYFLEYSFLTNCSINIVGLSLFFLDNS